MNWEIFTGIAALVAFVVTFVKLTDKLSTAITELKCSVDTLNEKIDRNDREIESIEKELGDHEVRIAKIEEKV